VPSVPVLLRHHVAPQSHQRTPLIHCDCWSLCLAKGDRNHGRTSVYSGVAALPCAQVGVQSRGDDLVVAIGLHIAHGVSFLAGVSVSGQTSMPKHSVAGICPTLSSLENHPASSSWGDEAAGVGSLVVVGWSLYMMGVEESRSSLKGTGGAPAQMATPPLGIEMVGGDGRRFFEKVRLWWLGTSSRGQPWSRSVGLAMIMLCVRFRWWMCSSSLPSQSQSPIPSSLIPRPRRRCAMSLRCRAVCAGRMPGAVVGVSGA